MHERSADREGWLEKLVESVWIWRGGDSSDVVLPLEDVSGENELSVIIDE